MLPREISDQAPAEPASSDFRREKPARFVGRAVELDVFLSALSEPRPPSPLLYVWGDAGIGKTSLLEEMARLAEQHSVSCTRFDARLLYTSVSDGGGPLWRLQKNQARQVLLFDQFEKLEPLEPWLRKQLLPSLPPETLVVLASRRPPSLDWTLHGWSSFMRVLELAELTEIEALDLLTRRGMSLHEHAGAARIGGGSPLPLALACDVSDQATDFRFDELERPGVPGLAAALLEATSRDRRRRHALGLCAVARFTTPELLERAFPRSIARQLFEWLQRLSFVQASPRGLQPHPLVRRSILDELRRHHPSAYLDLERELRAFYAYKATADDDRGSWVTDRMWLDRDVSGISQYLDPNDGETPAFARPSPEHHRRILQLIEHHEGIDSSRIAAQWLRALPHSFEIQQSPSDPVSALLLTFVIARDATPAVKIADPMLELVSRHARSRIRFSEGESATLFRYFLTARAHQTPCPELNLLFAHAAKRLAERQRLAFSYFAVAEPDRWISLARSCGLAAGKVSSMRSRGGELTILSVDWRGKSFIDVFSRWVQTSASESVGRAWQIATTRPMRAAPVYRSGTISEARSEPPLTADPDDDRRALEELLEERVERLSAAAKLSPRERQVLNFVLLGRHAEDMASVIAIAPRTARLHLSHLLTKLGAESRLDVFRVLS